jgi:shikimate dehydrogenase
MRSAVASGGTYLTGLIGAGIGSSLSPALHEHEGTALGLRYAYRLIDIADAGLSAADTPGLIRSARLAGFDGLNITYPCKRAAVSGVTDLSPEAEALGAVNTVVFDGDRVTGHNTDWSGFARSLRRGLPGAPLGHVAVLGAGGAGSAVSYALARLGAERLTLLDADEPRAEDLAASLAPRFRGQHVAHAPLGELARVLARADGLVHATPTGMAAHPGIAVPDGALRPGLWVADVVYRPLETELVRAARKAGCPTLDGGPMAVFQAADAFALFTGHKPDPGRMLADFDRLTSLEQESLQQASPTPEGNRG